MGKRLLAAKSVRQFDRQCDQGMRPGRTYRRAKRIYRQAIQSALWIKYEINFYSRNYLMGSNVLYLFILALILVALCMPGIWLMSKYTASDLFDKADNQLSKQALFIMLVIQTIMNVILSVTAGF
ncbi:hypothetical protein SAMN04488542_11512 [Fontibacillus panacisegetis]|uniref:Uncharacterized protein n=1 Tax=Fontibacillus panacisegetis TaxID=670482 RepID=A0A1G7N3X9_9BACL|nr:hypothetical protein [Fontibacillus panacisegetis]SDF68714.1 hypothetical protein SAMN04488542_11512 [Fontibacillus panacisegetis]